MRSHLAQQSSLAIREKDIPTWMDFHVVHGVELTAKEIVEDHGSVIGHLRIVFAVLRPDRYHAYIPPHPLPMTAT